MTHHEPHDDELARRLRASVSHRIPEEARQQHLAAIERALSDAAPSPTVAASGWFTQLRRGLTAVAASLSLLAPTGVAVASQSAMPGEPLYDVKQVTEVVRQIVDGSVRARNRLDELERLLDAGAPRGELEVAVQRALDALQALPADHPLQLRLLGLLNRYDRLVAAPSDDRGDGDRGDDDREDRSGSGSDDDDADDGNSGPGSDDDPTETDTDDDSSGSGSGTDDDPEDETDDDSSGPGSGDDPTETDDASDDDDSSGSGSGDDDTDDDNDDDSGAGSD